MADFSEGGLLSKTKWRSANINCTSSKGGHPLMMSLKFGDFLSYEISCFNLAYITGVTNCEPPAPTCLTSLVNGHIVLY